MPGHQGVQQDVQSRHLTALSASAAVAAVSILVGGCARSASVEHSLDRVEALLVILEGIEDEPDVEIATPAIQDWLAGCQQHDLETAWMESVSGQEYVALVEPHASRSAELRHRLELQFDRMSTDAHLEELASAMQSARSLIPPPLADS
jgi:hypothetical protein